MNSRSSTRKINGWILDITSHPHGMILWIKTPTGKVISGLYPYHPSFYIVHQHHQIWKKKGILKQEYRGYIRLLQKNPEISEISLVKRRIKAEHACKSLVLEIIVKAPKLFKKVVRQIQKFNCFSLYNVDLPLTQMFLYNTQLFPFARCVFTLSHLTSQPMHIVSVSLKDSNEEIFYQIPPVKVIWLNIQASYNGIQRSVTDQIAKIEISIDPAGEMIPLLSMFPPDLIHISNGHPKLIIDENNEYEMLLTLQKAIQKIDPDIIFTKKGDEHLFPYLLARLTKHHLDREFSLSRDKTPLKYSCFRRGGNNSYMSYGQVFHRSESEFYLTGRLHIDSAIYGGLHFDDGNLYGIVEVARVTYSPLQRLTRVTIGGALQSLQFYHAYQQGVLIEEEKKNSEYFRRGSNLLLSDRGGHILNPQIGMFDRVAELDFTSMYPALMVNYNVSPETINCTCCEPDYLIPGLPYHICQKRKGIVSLALRVPLAKRMEYKRLASNKTNKEVRKYRKMEGALKWILVVCFGYLGFRNARFGRIEAHQAVCAFAREFLLKGKRIIEKHGLQTIHGIVDSLYVQAPSSMSLPEFHQKCKMAVAEIEKTTRIPISYDPTHDYFRFMCFLPTKEDPEVGALNRYWGVKSNDSVKVRGIEIRRHDAPPFIKDFQYHVMKTIVKFLDRHDLRALLHHLIPVLISYYERLESRNVRIQDLLITIRLSRHPYQYKVQNYQAIAARKLSNHGISVGAGEKISFVITDDQNPEAMNRVQPMPLLDEHNFQYDIFKYKELLVRALVNLLPDPLSDQQKDFLLSLDSSFNLSKAKKQKTISAYL